MRFEEPIEFYIKALIFGNIIIIAFLMMFIYICDRYNTEPWILIIGGILVDIIAYVAIYKFSIISWLDRYRKDRNYDKWK